MKLNLYYEYDFNIGPDDDDGDGFKWSGYSHEVRLNHSFYFLEQKEDVWHFEQEFEADITKPIYLCYVEYSSGGTFGRTDGYIHVLGIGNDYNSLLSLYNKVNANPKKCNLDYKPWVGYFSHFQSIHLILLHNKNERFR